MRPSSATQRKNKPPGGAIGNGTTHIETPLAAPVAEAELMPLSSAGVGDDGASGSTSILAVSQQPPPHVVVAEVHRRFCGTGPFDKHWLNLDCCGLFCAVFTYGLHIYGCWAVCRKLLPAWMSNRTEDGIREVSLCPIRIS
jgi:hypothetical protein